MKSFATDTWLIARIFLRSLRFYGIFTYVLSVFFPLAMFAFLHFLLGRIDADKALYLISGNIVMSVIGICVTTLGQVITNMKNDNAIEFYASLPIKSMSVVFGISVAYLLINTPSFFMVLIAGAWLFDVRVSPHFGIPLFIVATVWALSGVGAIIGSYSKSIQAGTILSLVVGFSMYMLAPVFFPAEVFPSWAQSVSALVPSTFSADGIHAALLGRFGAHEGACLAKLVIFGIALNLLVGLKFKFRRKGRSHA
jgi:ABC-2 type transport system permease protein